MPISIDNSGACFFSVPSGGQLATRLITRLLCSANSATGAAGGSCLAWLRHILHIISWPVPFSLAAFPAQCPAMTHCVRSCWQLMLPGASAGSPAVGQFCVIYGFRHHVAALSDGGRCSCQRDFAYLLCQPHADEGEDASSSSTFSASGVSVECLISWSFFDVKSRRRLARMNLATAANSWLA